MLEEKIIHFLEEILNNMKNKELSDDDLRKVTEFYLSYNFLNINEEDGDNFTDKDLVSFLSLGWYIYENEVKKVKI